MDSRDTLIARQSQMKNAIDYFNMMGIKPTVLELVAMADHFVQYIQNGVNKEIITKSKNVDEFVQKRLNQS